MSLNWTECPKCAGTGQTLLMVPVNIGSTTDPMWVNRHIKCGYVSSDMPLVGGKFKKQRKKKA